MRGCALHSSCGMDAFSGGSTANGSDGEGCGVGAGGEEPDSSVAKFRHSRVLGYRGMGGGGYARVICLRTDGAHAEGAAKLFDMSDAITPEGHVSRVGEFFAIGSILHVRRGASGADIRAERPGARMSKG